MSGRRIFVLMVLGTALSGRGSWAAPADAAGPTFTELSAADAARLDRQREVVLAEARKRYGKAAVLTRGQADLALLQRLLDDHAFAKDQTYQLQSLGVVFGDVLASELPMRWMMVTDEYGTDPTLRYKTSIININALTMISKRVERGEKVNVQHLLQETARQVAQLEKQFRAEGRKGR
jgi:hypothetical protein